MSYGFFQVRAVSHPSFAAALFCILLAPCAAAPGDEPNAKVLGPQYRRDIRPLMERYCHDCHGASDVVEGDINLAAMKGWDDVARHPKTWQKVAEMLGNGLMPPQDAEQPTKEERAQLQKWVADDLALEAKAHAGDPGRVVLRRLNNAEYTWVFLSGLVWNSGVTGHR